MNIQELHQILYEMLAEIDKACKKEHVPYMLGGGTLLGAVRNGKFIPWDDDIDLAVWSRDYPAMRAALRKHLPKHLRLIEPHDFFPNFYDFICRVQDTRYHWHVPSETDAVYEGKQNYVSVDIFIINYSAHSRLGTAVNAFRHKVIYGLAMGHRPALSYEKYTIVQKLETSFLAYIGKNIPLKIIFKWNEQTSSRNSERPRKYCLVTNNIPLYMSLPYESEWFEETIEMPFEEGLFPVQKGYHKKLALQYGNNYLVPVKNDENFIIHADLQEE